MDPVMILIDLVILMVSGVVEVVRTDTATLTMLRNVLEWFRYDFNDGDDNDDNNDQESEEADPPGHQAGLHHHWVWEEDQGAVWGGAGDCLQGECNLNVFF